MESQELLIRLPVRPIVENLVDDDEKTVTPQLLCGPFTFPKEAFAKTLVEGNQKFGNMNRENEKKSIAQKRMLDVVFKLYSTLSNSGGTMKAKRMLLLTSLKDGKTAAETRAAPTIAEAYAHVEAFHFFIEMEFGQTQADARDPEEDRDEDDVGVGIDNAVEEMINSNLRAAKSDEEKSTSKKANKEKRGAIFRINCNKTTKGVYDLTSDSRSMAETFHSIPQFGRMVDKFLGGVTGYSDTMVYQNLKNAPYAFSKLFNYPKLLQEESPRRLEQWVQESPVYGAMFNLCYERGLAFHITNSWADENFGKFMFPDIRQTRDSSGDPTPEDEHGLNSTNLENLAENVQTEGVSAWESLKKRIEPSLAAVHEEISRIEDMREKRKRWRSWQKTATQAVVSCLRQDALIGGSIKEVTKWFEMKIEYEGHVKVPTLRKFSESNLDPQQSYLCFMYTMFENLGIFCNHSVAVEVFMKAMWACVYSREKPPGVILVGPGGTGKSHVLETVRVLVNDFLQELVADMSTRSWAVQAEGRSNPDEYMTNKIFFFDEMKARHIGGGQTNIRGHSGEGEDSVAIFKQMSTGAPMSYQRNEEGLRADGTKTRKLVKGTQNTHGLVILGCSNEHMRNVNAPMLRRFDFKMCIKVKRADDITLEDCKNKEEGAKAAMSTDPYKKAAREEKQYYEDFFKMNTALHLIYDKLEVVGIVRPVEMKSWNVVRSILVKVMESKTCTSHLSDRVLECEKMLTNFVKSYGIAMMLQHEESPFIKKYGDKLSFDDICDGLLRAEPYMIAGEKMCISVLASLNDACFPKIHKLIFAAIDKAILSKNGPDEETSNYTREPVCPVTKKKLTLYLELTGIRKDFMRTFKKKSKDTAKDHAVDALFDVLEPELKKSFDSVNLAKCSLEELFEAEYGSGEQKNRIFQAVEDEHGKIMVIMLKEKFSKYDEDIETIISECAHSCTPEGTQLLMMPHKTENGKYLPQFPKYMNFGRHAPSCPGDEGCNCFRSNVIEVLNANYKPPEERERRRETFGDKVSHPEHARDDEPYFRVDTDLDDVAFKQRMMDLYYDPESSQHVKMYHPRKNAAVYTTSEQKPPYPESLAKQILDRMKKRKAPASRKRKAMSLLDSLI